MWEYLGIQESGMLAINRKNDAGGDHRAGKRASPGLVASRNAAITFLVQVALKPEVVCVVATRGKDAVQCLPSPNML